MDEKDRKRPRIVYAIMIILAMIFFSACAEPDIIIEDEPAAEIKSAPAEEPEPVEEPENITDEPAEESMEIKLIMAYDHFYVAESGRVYGIAKNYITPIVFEDESGNDIGNPEQFFILDGAIYIEFKIPDADGTEKILYFRQSGTTVKEVKSIPLFPEAVVAELDNPPFKIVSGDYQGTAISEVYNGTMQINYLPITGAAVNDNGMWYSVPETYGPRLAGLYLWETDDTAGRLKMEGSGRLW